MASQSTSRPLVAVLAWLVAAPLAAQAPAPAPAPVRLTFADAVRRAAGTAPAVELAGLRTDEASARVGQARAALLPSLAASAGWVNRTFNKNSLGIKFPAFGGFSLPELIGPFNTYDTRLQLSQTLLDFSSMGRGRAARAQVSSARAQGRAGPQGAAAGAGRPDLRAEVALGDAARSAQAAIAAERLPRIGVEADYGSNGPTPGSSIGTGQVALQVSLPILDGFRRERRADEQRAQVRESEVRVRDLHQQIVADGDGALLDLASAAAQQGIAAERLKLANDELAQARERFKAGVAGKIGGLDADASLPRAPGTANHARVAAASARGSPARAGGGAR